MVQSCTSKGSPPLLPGALPAPFAQQGTSQSSGSPTEVPMPQSPPHSQQIQDTNLTFPFQGKPLFFQSGLSPGSSFHCRLSLFHL